MTYLISNSSSDAKLTSFSNMYIVWLYRLNGNFVLKTLSKPVVAMIRVSVLALELMQQYLLERII
jgi:hypothetical protein